MSLSERILNAIKAFVIKRASSNNMIDIVEVRTQEIGLTSVTTETDIRIKNSFFLPITILSIKTDLLNRDGLKVGRMNYEHPQKIKGNSDEVLTTVSEISIITSIFQAISHLLMQTISMRSVGIAKIKFLWWIIEIPVDDQFDIHPDKLKILKDETPEELVLRKQREEALREQHRILKEQRKASRAELKEELLKKRYKENYIPKEERDQKNIEFVITNEEQMNKEDVVISNTAEDMEIVLDANALQQMAEENPSETEIKKDETI